MEQRAGPREADVLAIEQRQSPIANDQIGLATAERPTAQLIRRSASAFYAARANRIVLRHHLGRIIAVVEVVSPGNKEGRHALREFVAKTAEYLQSGIHVLVVDLLPPGPLDPFGIHKAIWDEIEEEGFSFPPGKDRILASYEAGDERAAYVNAVAVGDVLPEMPLFIAPSWHVPVPLEATYWDTWIASPEMLRTAVETGILPAAGE